MPYLFTPFSLNTFIFIYCIRHQTWQFKYFVPICVFNFMKILNFKRVKPYTLVRDILDRRFRYIRLQIPTSSIILWTSLTRQPMLSVTFPDIRGRPGDLPFFFKPIKLGSNRFADRTVSSICTEEIARHPYSGFVVGQRHYALYFLSRVQLAGHTATKSLCRMRGSHTRTCLQTYVS